MKRFFYYIVGVYFLFNLMIIFKTDRPVSTSLLRKPNLLHFVDVFYGTGTVQPHICSTGNQIPISARPFGNNHWTVTTNNKSPRSFDRYSKTFYGIRCTHFASVWIGDYAFFDMSPSIKPLTVIDYDMSPSKITVNFQDNAKLTLIPTDVGAVMTFDGINEMVLKRLNYKLIDEYTIVGTAKETSVFSSPSHTILHVVIKSNTAMTNRLEVTDDTVWRIGTSFISESQAFKNIPLSDPQFVLKANDEEWNFLLNRIKVEGLADKRKFYTILYRTLLFPRLLKEPNGMHYSPYSKNGDIFKGELSTDSGFWDAYRTVYPFLHLVYPDYAKRILNGWVNSIKESQDNMLAQWASPAKVDSMEGAMGEISIAEGIMNGAIDDVDTAWQYLYRSCFTKAGRAHFDEYVLFGYVPGQVSLSLNYYLSDYVVSIVAEKLGHVREANELRKRSGNWKLLFNHNTKMFDSKSKDGIFKFSDEYKWMGPFREGGPWQYRFYVPHDPEGLDLYGYEGTMCKYLNDMMTNTHQPSSTFSMIHEEKELYKHMFGQYAHNNQPVHHILYLFHHVGCMKDGAKWIRKVLDESYTDTGYPGDEDNGEMSAWYILSSLGLYSLVPGSLQYQISSAPIWNHVDIDNGRIIIERSGNGIVPKTVTVNGQHQASIFDYSYMEKYKIQIKNE